MSTHQNVKTSDISSSDAWYTDPGTVGSIAKDDIIETNGYFSAGDGGGATFTVRKKEAGEVPDGYFVLSIYRENNADDLVAVMELPADGMVNVEQLGVLPMANCPDLYAVNTENYSTWYSTIGMNGFDESGNGAEAIETALLYPSVRGVRFAEGQSYPIEGTIPIECSDKIIEGNNTRLIAYGYPSILFEIEEGVENITFRDLRMAAVSPFPDGVCIFANEAENVTLENVDFVLSGYGVFVTDCSRLTLKNVHAIKCVKLLHADTSTDIMLEDLTFSDPFLGNAGSISGLSHAVLEFGTGCARVTLRDACILGSVCGSAVSVVGTQASPVMHVIMLGVTAENVGNVFYCKEVHNLTARQIRAAEIDCAVTMENVRNVMMEESVFRRRAAATSALIAPAAGVCRNVFFNNSLFDADAWFRVQNRLINNEPVLGDKIRFENCMFRAGALAASSVPARFENSITDLSFAHCHFYAQSLDNSGCLFYLSSDADANSRLSFMGCMFTSAAGNVNSPFRVSLDNGETVYLHLAGCTFCGFNWSTRLVMDNNTVVPGETVDPAANGVPTESDAQTASQRLTALARFLALHNAYLYLTLPTGQTEYCRRAETYGVTV